MAERFPCPQCGAGLLYDPRAKGLRCPFCGEARTVDGSGPVLEKDLEAALRAAAGAAAAPREARRVLCEACGAEVEVPPGEKSGKCPYCGSTRVHDEPAGPGRIPPEAAIPFAVDRVAAEERFRTWVRSLWFRPNAIRSQHALAEMRGVMVPYWTFDARADSSWTAMAGYTYVVPVPTSKGVRMQTRIRWEPAAGSRSDLHDDLLICASRGLEPSLLRKIEPFDLKGLAPFQEEYLAGWFAESCAVEVREAWARAEERIRAEQVSRCGGDVPGNTHRDLQVSTTLSGKRYRHALLPVWVAAYRFRNKAWRFLVNGQTGEVQGEAPLSWVKIALLVLGVLAGIGVILAIAASR